MSEQTVIHGGPDWFGRLMSFGALAVAAASLYYTYTLQNGELPFAKKSAGGGVAKAGFENPLDSIVPPNDADGAEATPNPTTENDSASGQETGDEGSASGDLDSMLGAATTSTDDLADNSGAVDDAPVKDAPVKDAPVDDGLVDDGLVDDGLVENVDDPLDDPIESPRASLIAVRTAFRPSGDIDAATVTVRNTGNAAAMITQLTFEPGESINVPIGAATRPSWGATNDTQLVLRLDDSDNQSQISGKHGDYLRRLEPSYYVGAGNAADIKLAINNDEHLGYGLRGRLKVEIANGDPVIIDDVAIAFTASP